MALESFFIVLRIYLITPVSQIKDHVLRKFYLVLLFQMNSVIVSFFYLIDERKQSGWSDEAWTNIYDWADDKFRLLI